MQRHLLACLIGSLFSSAVLAAPSFIVRDIRVEGIQRTEAGTVFSYLPVKVGESFDDEKASQAIKTLFATGFFKDVRIETEGDVLIVIVDERPAIAQVDFIGVKEFDKDQLKKGLREVGLAESRIFDKALLDKAEQELKRQYLSRGKYAVTITTTVTPLERNRIGISFNVDEGEFAKIRQINIVGATTFPEKDLLDLFQLRTPNWLSWYTKADQYSKQKLSADLEALRSHYLNQGFIEFNIESTQVSISADKKDIFITVSVVEGERYIVSGVKLAGELLLPEEEFRRIVAIRPGDVFSREKLNETTKAIAERLGNEGYAFANVNAAPEINKEKKQVDFTLFIDPGRRVYVRRINVGGNVKTRDEVARREMRQMEGGWYDASKIAKSRDRIDRLGYFSEVTVETPPVPATTDQVDVNINVTEKPTGNLMLGAGFSSSEKLVLSGSVTQDNLFGSGKSLGVNVNSGKVNRVYSLSYTNPYFTVDGVSQGFDIYTRTTDPTALSIGTYRTKSTGGGVRFGFPISDTEKLSFGLSGDQTKITTDPTSPPRYITFVNQFGSTNTTTLGTIGWTKDTKDSYLYPTKGGTQSATLEVSIPPGSLKYYRATYQNKQFFPIGKDLTLMLNGELALGGGYGGKPLPFYKNFYAGGIGSVRGYDTASLGPIEVGERVGGTRRYIGNVELLMPMPGFGKDRSVRWGAFLDAGQVYGDTGKVDFGDLRFSTGVSLFWSSPVGPLSFSIAQPLNRQQNDKVQRFQFQLGTVF
jgi:outer membrane protein insertion porin family